MNIDPLALAFALTVAALVGATALLGIVRSQAEPARLPIPAGRGAHRDGEFPDRPRSGWRPAHRAVGQETALDGWPLVTVAVVCSVAVVGMLAALASGPVGRAARMLSDVSAVLIGWVA